MKERVMPKEDDMGLGAMHPVTVTGSLGFEGEVKAEVITSTIHRPGLESETLVYLRDTPLADILSESCVVAGLRISEVEIEDIEKKIKRSGFPIKVGGGYSPEGAHFDLELKSKEEIKTYRKVTLKFKK
jgi:hypothetical protein